jgi:hypothetical protein
MKSFKELFNTILTADKDESRKASREVRKLLYSSHYDRNSSFNDMGLIIQNAPVEYAKIKEEFRQENFAVAISVIYYLHNRDDKPDFLFPWLFELLKHDNGNIRQAARRMISHEFGPLTYHIRFPGQKSSFGDLAPEIADDILYRLFMILRNFINALWQPKYNRFKYIHSLPAGTFKTTQLILNDLEDFCGEEYVKKLEYNQVGIPSPFL